MNRYMIIYAFSIFAFCSIMGWSHDGHGITNGHSFFHFILEPIHSVWLIPALFILWKLKSYFKTNKGSSDKN